MSAALSSELRTRFREYLEEGLSGRAAAARLRLSAATGVRWQRKWRETGSVAPGAQGRPPGQGKLAAHQGLLEELVAQDGDITLPELAVALASVTGVVAHAASIGRFLRKLGYTYKKVTGRNRILHVARGAFAFVSGALPDTGGGPQGGTSGGIGVQYSLAYTGETARHPRRQWPRFPVAGLWVRMCGMGDRSGLSTAGKSSLRRSRRTVDRDHDGGRGPVAGNKAILGRGQGRL